MARQKIKPGLPTRQQIIDFITSSDTPAGKREIARYVLPECTDEVWHGYLPDAGPGVEDQPVVVVALRGRHGRHGHGDRCANDLGSLHSWVVHATLSESAQDARA